MKRIFTLLAFVSITLFSIAQTTHTIVTSGLAYSPDELTVSIGDMVEFTISSTHPTTEVSEDTWNANGATPLAGGFGTNTSSFTITITEPGVIYYVCDNHIGSGMKGTITVNPSGLNELVNEVEIDFGRMPIDNGVLSYSIQANENDLGTLRVISVGGQEVANQLLDSKEGQIYINASSGVYVALLENRDGKIIYRESISIK